MFGAKPECPIDAESRDWIERRWGWLVERFGADRARIIRVVLPTPEFFPDVYESDRTSARSVLDRVCSYLSIDPESIELTLLRIDTTPIVEEGAPLGLLGQERVSAGTHEVQLPVEVLDDPLVLVAAITRQLCRFLLVDRFAVDPNSASAADHEHLADLTAVYLGVGVILANAVLRESLSLNAGTPGWEMGRHAFLSMPMFGYALAKFAALREEKSPAWAAELRPDVRTAFDAANRFLAAGSPIVSGKPKTEIDASRLNWELDRDPTSNERDDLVGGGQADEAEPDVEVMLENLYRRDRLILPKFAGLVERIVPKIFFAFLGVLAGFVVGAIGAVIVGDVLGHSKLAGVVLAVCAIAGGIIALLQVTQRR